MAKKWMIEMMRSKTLSTFRNSQSSLMKATHHEFLGLWSSLYCKESRFSFLTFDERVTLENQCHCLTYPCRQLKVLEYRLDGDKRKVQYKP